MSSYILPVTSNSLTVAAYSRLEQYSLFPSSNEMQSLAASIRWQRDGKTFVASLQVNLHHVLTLLAILSGSDQSYLALFTEQSLWLAIAIPEDAALPEIQRERSFILSKILTASVVLQIRQGESLTQEFKSTLRWNLKTGKPGKEIELAWLKTVVAYLNTKGGKLFIGVSDNDEILGLDADKFKNDDKLLLHVNNLIKQHIGLAFSQYITVELHTLEERKILVIACEPAAEPVFLTHQNEEHFYIRTGPSSTRLSVSEVLKYLAQRQGTK